MLDALGTLCASIFPVFSGSSAGEVQQGEIPKRWNSGFQVAVKDISGLPQPPAREAIAEPKPYAPSDKCKPEKPEK